MAEQRSTGQRTEVSHDQRSLERSAGRTRDLGTRRDPFDAFGFGPFAIIRRMQEDIDRLFGGLGTARGSLAPFGREIGDWAPAIDVFQRGNELVIRADVPGLSREDLSVEMGDDALTIRGERKYDREEEREGVFQSERAYGSFCRVVPLPEGVVAESAKANFKDGVLEVVVQAPPPEVRRGRQIEIAEERTQKSGEQKK